jgi:hypothetical protein
LPYEKWIFRISNFLLGVYNVFRVLPVSIALRSTYDPYYQEIYSLVDV